MISKGSCFDPCYVVTCIKKVFFKHLRVRWVTENKWIEAQVGKVLSFKPQVGKMKTGQTTGEFTVISPYLNFRWDLVGISGFVH